MDGCRDTHILLFRFLLVTPEHPYCFSRYITGKTKIFLISFILSPFYLVLDHLTLLPTLWDSLIGSSKYK